MFSKHLVEQELVSFTNNGAYKPVSRVTLKLDDENVVTAGNDTGYELVADCPYATQEMAETLLSKYKGYVYQAYEAAAADIDPAAELGDGVWADEYYVTLARIDDDGNGYPTLSAPGKAELEDEYPSDGPMAKEFNRKIAETRSMITKTAEEIRAEVFGENGLEASLKVTLNEITGQISGLDGKYSALSLTIDGIKGEVSGLNGKYSTVSQTLDGLTVTTDEGETKIKGGSVETENLKVYAANISGKLTADQIDATDLKVDAANITGRLTIGKLPTSVARKSDIPTKVSELDNDERYLEETGVVELIGGIVTADYVNALGVKARYLQGKYIYLMDRDGNRAGQFSITAAETADCAVDLTSYGGLRLTARQGDFYVVNGGNRYLHLQAEDGYCTLGNVDFRPNVNRRYTCGTEDFSWADVYVQGQSLVALVEDFEARISALEETA